jgi:glycerol-3-phosphate acyltransferase PlsY
MLVVLIILAVISYCLGALPTAYLVAKKLTGQDIRTQGSGNVGSTNAVRVLGPKVGALVFVVDVLKGFIPALLGYWLSGPLAGIIFGGLALVGHVFPVWLKFKGGKGVATGVGVVLALFPLLGVLSLLLWVIVLLLTDCVAAASSAASASVPVALFFAGVPWPYVLAFLLLVGLIIYKHRVNFAPLKTKLNRTDN